MSKQQSASTAITHGEWIGPTIPVIQVRHEFTIVNEKNETIVSLTAEQMNGVMWLTNLWVHHEHRRQGNARCIIDAAIKLYGGQDLWLKVHPYTNRPMDESELSQFYFSFGFRDSGAPGVMCRKAT